LYRSKTQIGIYNSCNACGMDTEISRRAFNPFCLNDIIELSKSYTGSVYFYCNRWFF